MIPKVIPIVMRPGAAKSLYDAYTRDELNIATGAVEAASEMFKDNSLLDILVNYADGIEASTAVLCKIPSSQVCSIVCDTLRSLVIAHRKQELDEFEEFMNAPTYEKKIEDKKDE